MAVTEKSAAKMLRRLSGTKCTPKEKASQVIASVSNKLGLIDLSYMKKLPGGGTHDIYRLSEEESPEYLLKIIMETYDFSRREKKRKHGFLEKSYQALYRAFDEARCLVEHREIKLVASSEGSKPKEAIVSVVPFSACFKSEIQLGFNVKPVEMDEVLLNRLPEKYHALNESLMGEKSSAAFNLEDFLLLHPRFAPFFEKIEKDENFKKVLTEFLVKYKRFYQETGILLDTIGTDNVLFYQEGGQWQFKVGSVIKHDNKPLLLERLKKLAISPERIKDSIKAQTSVFYMSSCIRVLNALGLQVGMGKVIEDIVLSKQDSVNLLKSHLQLKNSTRAITYVMAGDFKQVLHFFKAHQAEETPHSHETHVRWLLGMRFFEVLTKGEIDFSKFEVAQHLAMLKEDKNEFRPSNLEGVKEVIRRLETWMEDTIKKEETTLSSRP